MRPLAKSNPHQRDYYGLTTLLAAHPSMRQLKHQRARTSLHGNKVWAASYLMMAYLQQHPLAPGLQVLEVGCGSGLAGLYCAKQYQAHLTASDADPAVLPALELHANINGIELSWQQALFSDFTPHQLAKVDVLLACDICFWDGMTEDVASLIDKAVSAGVGQILIADPMRPPFLALAEYCIDRHFAELLAIEARSSRRHKGAILVIENR